MKLGKPLGITLAGNPLIVNKGRIRIGRNFFLSSSPVISHLITETTGELSIGDDVAIGYGAAIYCEKEVRIGSGSRLGPYCVLADTDFHVIGDSLRRPIPRPISIGSGVTIGARVNILAGATIGDHAVVMAGSTVAGSVAAGAVVSGVPAAVGGSQKSEGDSLDDRVRKLVRDALGLPVAPADDARRADIPQWDSLSALRITMGIEGAFSTTLTEREVTSIQSVRDLIDIVRTKAKPAF